jgi:hypothetical protein
MESFPYLETECPLAHEEWMLTLYYSRQGCHWVRLLQRLEEVRAEASGNPSAVHRSYVPLFRHIGS